MAKGFPKLALVAVPLVAGLAWIVFRDDAAPERRVPVAKRETPERAAPSETPASTDTDVALRVRGRVLDPYGEPLGRALVGEVDSERPAVTAGDGTFALAVGAGRASITLMVVAAGHAPFLSQHDVEPDLGDIQLVAGGGMRGRIIDEAGNGLPDAVVTLRPASRSAWPPTVDLDQLLKPAATDADGAYAFANLAPGRYRIEASAPGRQVTRSRATVMEGSVTTVDPLVLKVGYDLAGLVVAPDDAPVKGATVRIRGNRYRGEMVTADDGRFETSALPRGPLRVEVAKPGFLRYSRDDVDPTADDELVVRLEGGLRITGTVVDAATGRPVERFAASIQRIGRLDPTSNGTMVQQLQRHVEALRAAAGGAADAEARARQLRIAKELEARLERVRQEAPSRPVAVPADVGPVHERPQGRFSFDGLEEGLYSIGIASPEHLFAEKKPVEVRHGMPAPDLRVEVDAGHALSGVVVAKRDGAPVPGATVELVRVLPAAEGRRSMYPWAFAPGGPQGVTVMATRTDDRGRFEFRQAAPGRCLLSVRHPRFADHESDVFDVRGEKRAMRVAIGTRAALTGRVGNVPASQRGNVEVVVLGGHGTIRTVKAQPDGTYRFDDLQPGSYIVRAFPSDASRYVRRLISSIFPLHAAAVDPEKIPERDVTLAEGENGVFDVELDVPPSGVLKGTVSINGQPGRGLAILRPVPGEAPGSGGLSLRSDYDDRGRFTIDKVPAGKYTLTLYGATRQQLYKEPITVAPGATATVQADLAAGGLSGRVTAPDAASRDELRGYLWVLPGATEAPADLYAYRRANRTHRIRVRDGVFEDRGLTPGAAVLILDLRARARVATNAVIPAGDMLELGLTVGRRTR